MAGLLRPQPSGCVGVPGPGFSEMRPLGSARVLCCSRGRGAAVSGITSPPPGPHPPQPPLPAPARDTPSRSDCAMQVSGCHVLWLGLGRARGEPPGAPCLLGGEAAPDTCCLAGVCRACPFGPLSRWENNGGGGSPGLRKGWCGCGRLRWGRSVRCVSASVCGPCVCLPGFGLPRTENGGPAQGSPGHQHPPRESSPRLLWPPSCGPSSSHSVGDS